MSRRLVVTLVGAAALGTAAAAADDLTGRALVSYQGFDDGRLVSDGVHQLYDLRFERALTDPFRIRLSVRAERNDGGSDFGLGRETRSLSQLQPGGEIQYALPRLQARLTYDLVRLDSAVGPRGTADRRLERKTGLLTWRPEGLPGLTLQSDERGIEDLFAGLDRTQRLREGTLDYAWKGLSLAATRRGIELDDPGVGFARTTRESQGLVNYEGSWLDGRLTASANGLVTSSRLDDRSRGRTAAVPTPVPLARALYVNDDTPLDSRDRPPSPLSALLDGNLDRSTGVALGPEGTSFQTLVADAGRAAETELLRIHVRDGQGGLVRAGGPVVWDVFASRDGVEWRPLPAARTVFLAALGAYEVRFERVSSRFLKAVSFGTNTFSTYVTELEAFVETTLGPEETRRTDLLLGSGSATLGARPHAKVALNYYGLFNGLRQDSPGLARMTTRGIEHQVSAQYDPAASWSLIARYQDRSLAQGGERDDTYQAWTGIARVAVLKALDQALEATTSRETNLGRRIETGGVSLRTTAWFYPTLQVTLDLGVQRQDFVEDGFAVDRRFLSGVALAQLTRALKLTATATVQRGEYDNAAETLLPDQIGLPPVRDDRWTAELFYRGGSQLGAAVRIGQARTEDFTATLQRYHLDWFPFRGGAVALGGTYDQDVDSVGRRTARRLILTPSWIVNRRLVLNVNYTLIRVSGDPEQRTRAFQVTATMTL
jgi:hypothetical protein